MANENVETLEAEAIFLGTRLAIENEWEQVDIESYYEVVINQLRGDISYW